VAGGLLSAAIVPLVATDRAEVSTTTRTPQATGNAPLGIIIALSLVSLLTIIGEGTARTFFNVYFDTRLAVPTARIGAVAALAQLLAAGTSLATPALIDRIGTAKATLMGGLIKTLCLLPLALIGHWIPAGLGLMGLMAFAGILRPAFTIYHQESVAPHWRAAISGAITMATAMGFFIAAFVGGNLIPLIGYRGLFMIGVVASLAGMLLFWARFVIPARSAESVGAELRP
jgi:predicted MFS family arabinose efflux permease